MVKDKMGRQGIIKDLTGKRFGRLVVLEATDERSSERVVWKCRCDCGTEVYIDSGSLQNQTRSCGCLRKESAQKYRNILNIDGVLTLNGLLDTLQRLKRENKGSGNKAVCIRAGAKDIYLCGACDIKINQ